MERFRQETTFVQREEKKTKQGKCDEYSKIPHTHPQG